MQAGVSVADQQGDEDDQEDEEGNVLSPQPPSSVQWEAFHHSLPFSEKILKPGVNFKESDFHQVCHVFLMI